MIEKKEGRGEAGILPLNYSRTPDFSSTSLPSKELAFAALCLYCPFRPCQTMRSDRKVDSKTWLPIHFATASIYHSRRLRAASRARMHDPAYATTKRATRRCDGTIFALSEDNEYRGPCWVWGELHGHSSRWHALLVAFDQIANSDRPLYGARGSRSDPCRRWNRFESWTRWAPSECSPMPPARSKCSLRWNR
jgi:hypothetical protein